MKSKISKYIVILIVLFISCSDDKQPIEPTSFTIDDISNTSYRIVAKNDNDSVILLGRLNFNQIEDNEITGTWNLETWGKNSLFPTLAINEGKQFPTSANIGTFSGFISGNIAILEINLPSVDNSLGIVIKGILNEKLIGKITLLPNKEFDGSFEAIKILWDTLFF